MGMFSVSPLLGECEFSLQISFVVVRRRAVCRYTSSARFRLRASDDHSDERAKFSQKFKCFKVMTFFLSSSFDCVALSVRLWDCQPTGAGAAAWWSRGKASASVSLLHHETFSFRKVCDSGCERAAGFSQLESETGICSTPTMLSTFVAKCTYQFNFYLLPLSVLHLKVEMHLLLTRGLCKREKKIINVQQKNPRETANKSYPNVSNKRVVPLCRYEEHSARSKASAPNVAKVQTSKIELKKQRQVRKRTKTRLKISMGNGKEMEKVNRMVLATHTTHTHTCAPRAKWKRHR